MVLQSGLWRVCERPSLSCRGPCIYAPQSTPSIKHPTLASHSVVPEYGHAPSITMAASTPFMRHQSIQLLGCDQLVNPSRASSHAYPLRLRDPGRSTTNCRGEE